jgi:hypothetical protein
VRIDRERADAVGVKGTPTTVLIHNGKVEKILAGYLPYEKVKPELDRFSGRPVR